MGRFSSVFITRLVPSDAVCRPPPMLHHPHYDEMSHLCIYLLKTQVLLQRSFSEIFKNTLTAKLQIKTLNRGNSKDSRFEFSNAKEIVENTGVE